MKRPPESIEVDSLYVVSDLHLGGGAKTAVFKEGEALAWLIDTVAQHARAASNPVGLCLNGDIVDFLLGAQAKYLNVDTAMAILDALAQSQAFAPVFAALQRFTQVHQARLLLGLGNHDLELAQPAVRDVLFRHVAPSLDARERVVWSTSGFEGKIAGKNVRVVHGNATDDWNLIPQATLELVESAPAGSDPLAGVSPNAGTRLVVDVLNELKRHYAFVDLLKPEGEAVLPVILALPGGAERVQGLALPFAQAVGSMFLTKVKRLVGLLGAGGVGPIAAEFPGPAAERRDVDRSIEEIRSAARYALSLDLPIESQLPASFGALGLFDFIRARIHGLGPVAALHAGLWEYAQDADLTFSLGMGKSDDDIDRAEPDEVDVLIAGHTHLARSARRKRGNGWYFNTGTWMRLMRVTRELLAPPVFQVLYTRLWSNDLTELDLPIDGVPILYDRRPVAYVGPARHGQAQGAVLFDVSRQSGAFSLRALSRAD
jgi:UDP-2,3-diacylglucosamine pyrophosphatase LpxH